MPAHPMTTDATILSQTTSDLQQYLRFDTTNPPGDVRAAVEFLGSLVRRIGLPSQVLTADERAGKLNLLARLKGSGAAKPIVLINHIDVVPVEREKWSVDPFGGELRDGTIWARGALDMKAMGMAELAVVAMLKAFGCRLKRDVIWLAVCDEETGGEQGAKWLVEHHYDLLDPEFVIDEGGGGSRGLLTSDDRIVFAPSVNEKQILWLRLTARAPGGHGSMPEGETAVEILQQAIGRLWAAKARIENAADHPVVAEMRRRLGRLAENRYTNSITKHTITLTSFRAGVGEPPKVNVIPSEASATLDCRLLPGVEARHMLAQITSALADPRVNIEVLYEPTDEAISSSHETVLFRTIEQVVGELVPGAVVTPQLLPGGTDSRYFRSKGASAYGFEPMIASASDLDLIHSHDERIRVDEFHRMIRILHEVVRRVAQA